MPSGAKRRRAAKKKKEKKTAVIPNGNGDVKVVESDGAENSSPASQDLEKQQNPFTKDENKEPFLSTDSSENGKLSNVVEIAVEAKLERENGNDDGVIHGGMNTSTNKKLSRESVDDDESEIVEVEASVTDKEEDSKVVTHRESFASHVKDAASNVSPVVELESDAVVLEKVVNQPDSVPVQKSVGSAVAEERVHSSETFSASKADSPLLFNTDFGESSREISTKQMPESNILIGNGEWRAVSSDIQQCPEKEPLLPPAAGPANKTSWIGCCGILELFTGSSR